ncbi:hypothetical protein PT974_08200 [Cladobotryum mycophilum]|uniref:DUF3669 domain-containing protein n=1 Tax=Cladobotryum mycophilum TaxID=491253 RepID=A0ABR0SCN8_9HYPO
MDTSTHRRRLITSSEYSDNHHQPSPILERQLADNLRLLSLLESVEESDTTTTTTGLREIESGLNRMLSLYSQISTTSSNAAYHATAQEKDTESFKKIGAGACGAVFAKDGESLVAKLSKTNDDEPLWNDYITHSKIEAHFSKYSIQNICVPECYYFSDRESTAFFNLRPGLVKAAEQVCHLPTSALVTERILPLPKPTRDLLIQKYCSPRNKAKAFEDPANNDCLVRVYLGSKQGKSGGMFFSLRNFKLHLNQMVEIELDVNEMADRMAIAMAIMHWSAKTDARDVEFVLGSSSKKTPLKMPLEEIEKLRKPTSTGSVSGRDEEFFHRMTKLWVLDFNQVRPITMDEAGVVQAVEAARINDPYLPKPLQQSPLEKRLWNSFVVTYINASDIILQKEDKEMLALPRMFIKGLIETQREKQKAAEGRIE